MTQESPRHIEQEQKRIPIEKAVRWIRILANLREKKEKKKLLNEQERRLLPMLEHNVNAWLDERFAVLAISPREMPQRVAQWIYEGRQKDREQKGYQDTESQWLEEEKKKPEAERDPAYADRLSVYCMLMEDAALARKWMDDQKKTMEDKNASPLKRTNAREELQATGHALKALEERPLASTDARDIGKGLAKIKKSAVYRDLYDDFQALLRTPYGRADANRFIHETIDRKLKEVYNGSVPNEAYLRLIVELEEEVRHAAIKAQIKIGLEKKRREQRVA